MHYIEKNMLPGEILYDVIRPSLRGFNVGFVIASVLTLGIGLIVLFPSYIVRRIQNHFREISVTSNRVSKKTGIIARRVDEFLIRQIESVEIKQGVFGRIFDFGEVIIHGTGGDPMSCTVNEPRSFKSVIDRVVMSLEPGWRR